MMHNRDIKKWQYPDIDAELSAEMDTASNPAISEVEKIYRDAYRKGEQAAFEQIAMQQKNTRYEQLDALSGLIQYLHHPVLAVDQEIEHYLQVLVIQLVKRVIRHELKTDPNLIIKMIQEAKALIPVGHAKIMLYLSPDDFQLIGKIVEETFPDCECIESLELKQGSFDLKTSASEIISDFDQCIENLANQVFENA